LGPAGEAPVPLGCALPVPEGYRAADVWVPLVAAYSAEAVAARAATREMMVNCILDLFGWEVVVVLVVVVVEVGRINGIV
jgi:hypothetical protein